MLVQNPRKSEKLSVCDLPFAKRSQYKDEREYRVFGENTGNNHHFKFSPSSLERIYLNAWLCWSEYKDLKAEIEERYLDDFNDVEIKQNWILDSNKWQDAVKQIPKD
ncbi:MAG: hypothetical protein ABJE87_13935 [Roseobacter sp.]